MAPVKIKLPILLHLTTACCSLFCKFIKKNYLFVAPINFQCMIYISLHISEIISPSSFKYAAYSIFFLYIIHHYLGFTYIFFISI